MPDQPIKYNSQIDKDEHDDSANIGGKRVILHAWNSSTLQYERVTSTGGVLNTSGAGGGGGGDASAANQVTGNNSLASIDTKLTDVATQTTLALIKAKTDNLDTALSGIKTGTDKIITAPATSANQGTMIGSLSSIDTKLPTQGQALAAASMPVVLPAAQITSLTPPAAITNYANETGGNLATLAGIVSSSKASVKTADGDIASIGAKTDAKNTATDATSVSMISLLKQISAMVQAPATTPITGTVQPGNTQNTTPWLTALSANTGAVGPSVNYQSALTNTKVAVKTSAGNLYGLHIYNPNNVVTYIQIFNKASANITLGTTAPDFVLAVPPNGWLDDPASSVPIWAFGTACTIVATTTPSGSTAPTNSLLSNIFYL